MAQRSIHLVCAAHFEHYTHFIICNRGAPITDQCGIYVLGVRFTTARCRLYVHDIHEIIVTLHNIVKSRARSLYSRIPYTQHTHTLLELVYLQYYVHTMFFETIRRGRH